MSGPSTTALRRSMTRRLATLTIFTTRGTPLPPEELAKLRWAPHFRGDEGAILIPVTDNDGELHRAACNPRHRRRLQVATQSPVE